MTLPQLHAALREQEKRTGAVVVPEWLEYHDSADGSFYDAREENECYDIQPDAARLLLIGCMAEWLGGQGCAVTHGSDGDEDTEGKWFALLPPPLPPGYEGFDDWCWCELDATDSLSANFAACLARLADMPSGGRGVA